MSLLVKWALTIVVTALVVFIAIAASASASDGVPYTQAVGAHVYQLDDPVLTSTPSITFTGFVDSEDGPLQRAQPVIQQCKSGNGCKNDGAGWGAVWFGPVVRAGDATFNFEYNCTPSALGYFYRNVVTVIRADHSVVRVVDVTPGGYIKVNCK